MNDNINLLFRHFEKFIRLSDDLKQTLDERISFVCFKKGDLIQDADKVCTKSYFIQKGLVRAYFLKDGKEISEYFPAENEWCNSPKSFMTKGVIQYSLDESIRFNLFSLIKPS